MARPRNFSREGVLERALPVFWKHGFADASLQELEKATGVNKSGLYSEFSGKEELFLESLRFYLDRVAQHGLLMGEPLGWDNIEQFLKLGPRNTDGQKGCFAVSSIRELACHPATRSDRDAGTRPSAIEATHCQEYRGGKAEGRCKRLSRYGPDFLYGFESGAEP